MRLKEPFPTILPLPRTKQAGGPHSRNPRILNLKKMLYSMKSVSNFPKSLLSLLFPVFFSSFSDPLSLGSHRER